VDLSRPEALWSKPMRRRGSRFMWDDPASLQPKINIETAGQYGRSPLERFTDLALKNLFIPSLPASSVSEQKFFLYDSLMNTFLICNR
jgi:hypothetical protein